MYSNRQCYEIPYSKLLCTFSIPRGKGENYRLGHGTEEHIRHPKQVDGLAGKKVVDLSVGNMHSLAVTEDGEVYAWGCNDQGQLGETAQGVRTHPTLLTATEGKFIVGAACGPSQVSNCFQVYNIKLLRNKRSSDDICMNFSIVTYYQVISF